MLDEHHGINSKGLVSCETGADRYSQHREHDSAINDMLPVQRKHCPTAKTGQKVL
jgi:hypothetical protein